MNETTKKSPRRGRWFLLVLGLLIAIVALLPTLGGPWIVRRVLATFDEEHAGSVEIEKVRVGWFAGTRIDGATLRDADGAEVARVDVRAPSLGKLALGFGRDLGTIQVTARGALVADADGVTNLEQALAKVQAPDEEDEEGDDAGGESGESELPRATIELELTELSWTAPDTSGPLGVRDVRGTLTLDGSAALQLTGEVLGAEGGTLSIDAIVERPLADVEGDAPPAIRGDVTIVGLATGLVDALGGADGALVEVLGATVDLRAHAEGTTDAGSIEAQLDSPGANVVAQFALREGALVPVSDAPAVTATITNVAGLLTRAQPFLPEGATLHAGEPAGAITLELRELRATLGDATTTLEERLRSLDAALTVTLPALVYGHATGPLALRGATLEANLTSRAPAVVRIDARLDDGGVLVTNATIADPATILGEPQAVFDVEASNVPTGLVDRLAEQDGLLLDVLGATLALTVHGAWPLDDVPLDVSLTSSGGTIAFEGLASEGVLRAGDGGRLNAMVGLTPLFNERIVGELVPHLVQLQKDDPSERVALRVTDFALPLDGDLSKLAGTIELDLGAVRYDLLPGLGELLSLAGVNETRRRATFRPIGMRVENGIVRYEGLPLSIDGQEHPLTGSFNLASRAFDLEARLPLALIGQKALGELGKVVKSVSGETLVPVRLVGTWSRPRFAIPDGFVQDLLRQAGSGLLERGLRDLLDR